MITEASRKEVLQNSEEEEKKLCHEVIQASGIYERLNTNDDWKKVQAHMADISRLHSEQIAGYLGMMSQASFFKRMRLVDIIMVHQVRMEQLNEALNYPKRLMSEAVQARERLSQIKEKEKTS